MVTALRSMVLIPIPGIFLNHRTQNSPPLVSTLHEYERLASQGVRQSLVYTTNILYESRGSFLMKTKEQRVAGKPGDALAFSWALLKSFFASAMSTGRLIWLREPGHRQFANANQSSYVVAHDSGARCKNGVSSRHMPGGSYTCGPCQPWVSSNHSYLTRN
jgi:hypothetical protein